MDEPVGACVTVCQRFDVCWALVGLTNLGNVQDFQKNSLDLRLYANLGLRTELRAQACLAFPASPSVKAPSGYCQAGTSSAAPVADWPLRSSSIALTSPTLASWSRPSHAQPASSGPLAPSSAGHTRPRPRLSPPPRPQLIRLGSETAAPHLRARSSG